MHSARDDIKAEAHRLIDQLPEGASWADLLDAIYVHQQLLAGVRTADEGKVVDTQELRRNLGLNY